jgi:diacylglycerol kinase family enzyme
VSDRVRIGVLNNLRAGRSGPRIARVLSFLHDHPEVAHVETESGEDVPRALAMLADQGAELLVINGGDGTLQRTLTALLNDSVFPIFPLIAPLRGGRTNMSALDIGSHRNPVAALSALIAAVRQGVLAQHLVERAVLRIDLGSGQNVHYGMSFGVGLIPRAIELTHRLFPHGRAQGVFGSGVVTATLISRAIFNSADGILTPDRMDIHLDGRPVEHEQFYLAIATTLNHFFLKFRPFWGNENAPVRFTAVASTAARSFTAALRILRGQPPHHTGSLVGYTSHNVHQADLRLTGRVTVDGEMFTPPADGVVHLTADRRVRFVRT